MHKFIKITTLFLGFLLIIGCQTELSFTESKKDDLAFSRDTVYLDTIFTNTSSSTYQLKVYNRSNKDLYIPSIYLKKSDSKFRISIDGVTGKKHQNIEVLANDSLFVFIETTVDIKQNTTANEFLYTDALVFESTNGNQEVALVSLIKDAVFLYPSKQNGTTETLIINDEEIEGFFLDENDPINGNELHFTDEKPYVIYGYAAIAPNKTLVVDAGANIHFHNNSGLIAYPNAELQTNGTINKPIIFQGDRLEPAFEEISGQWGMIFIGQDAKATLNNTLIKNATIGLFINSFSQNNVLNNVQIYNCSNFGMVGRYAKIEAQNFVANNCGKASVALTYGGNYHFNQSTIVNYWNKPNAKTLSISDNESGLALDATFTNSIITGKNTKNLDIVPSENSTNFNFLFDYCYIKHYNEGITNQYPYDFDDDAHYNEVIISNTPTNQSVYFHNVEKNILIPTPDASNVVNKGNPIFAQQTPYDLAGNSRTANPDLGAYQHQELSNNRE